MSNSEYQSLVCYLCQILIIYILKSLNFAYNEADGWKNCNYVTWESFESTLSKCFCFKSDLSNEEGCLDVTLRKRAFHIQKANEEVFSQ